VAGNQRSRLPVLGGGSWVVPQRVLPSKPPRTVTRLSCLKIGERGVPR